MAIYTYALGADRVKAHWEAATIPQPSTLVLSVMGAVGLLGYGWRRRRREAGPLP